MACFNLNTTGTEVPGITEISDMIASTKFAGVTSYARFNKVSELKSRQSSRGLTLSPLSTKSSGSPKRLKSYYKIF